MAPPQTELGRRTTVGCSGVATTPGPAAARSRALPSHFANARLRPAIPFREFDLRPEVPCATFVFLGGCADLNRRPFLGRFWAGIGCRASNHVRSSRTDRKLRYESGSLQKGQQLSFGFQASHIPRVAR